MLDETPTSAVTTVLRELDAALTAGDAAAAAAVFEPDGFWRDLVSVTWNNLHQSRHDSQFLALQLEARQVGVPTPVYGVPPGHHLS